MLCPHRGLNHFSAQSAADYATMFILLFLNSYTQGQVYHSSDHFKQYYFVLLMILCAIDVLSTLKSVTPPVFNLQHVNIYCCKWDNRWEGVAISETDSIMGWFCRPFLSALPFWQQDHYLFLWCIKNRRSAANALQNDLQCANLVHLSVSDGDGCHDDGVRVRSLCLWRCAAWRAFAKEHQTLAFRWENICAEHMWQTWGSLEIHVLLSAASPSRTSLATVWRGTALHMLPEVSWLLLLGWDTKNHY